MDLKPVKGLRPFTKFLMTIGELPASYLVSMTYEEQLLWFCNYLQNTVIPTINNNGEAVEELQNLFIELKNYVDNYFENLDVQEEINNKLDEMAESGELANIIAQFLTLGVLFTFDTAANLGDAENLFDGASAYILGKDEYNDGKGAFYKIRQIRIDDVIDGDLIIAITASDNLVAEKLPNYEINEIDSTLETLTETTIPAIEGDITTINETTIPGIVNDYTGKINEVKEEINDKYDRTDNIYLQNYITYDINSSDYSQGSTNDYNRNLYIYKTENNSTGDLLVFSGESLSYTLQNVPFEHGNAIANIGNKIYASISGKKIKVLDLTNTSYSELNLFSDYVSYTELWGLARVDDTHLLCALGYGSGYVNNIANCLFALVDLTDNSFETFELTNTDNYNIDNLAFQSISYYNGHIYLLVSQPNMILDFIPSTDGDYNLNKLYNIPYRDNLGLVVGEVEQLSMWQRNPGTFLLTAHVKENYTKSVRTIKSYFISFDTELACLYHKILWNDIGGYRYPIYCNSGATTLYENGSSDYPFKSLTRALECVNYGKLYAAEQIVLVGGHYTVGTLYNLHGAINPLDSTATYFDDEELTLINCHIDFNSTYNNYNFNKIKIDSGVVNFNDRINTNNIITVVNATCNIESWNSSWSVAQSSPLRANGNSRVVCGTYATQHSGPFSYITDTSVVISNQSTATRTGYGTLIVTGNHSAD